MPRWTSLTVWSRLSERLSVSVGREFEKAVLPWLQIIWPTLTQPPELGHWDKKGIDLMSWSDEHGLDVVVQCKGYEVIEPGRQQLRQAKESIAKFRDAEQHADHYLLIYNRPGKNRDFHLELEESINELVSIGKVRKAAVWSRETILRHVFDAMARRIDAQLVESARELRLRLERFADLKLPFIKHVPIRVSQLRFKRNEPCVIHEVASSAPKDSEALLLSDGDYRWTLAVGHFGAGKTTAVLQASSQESTVPLYVPAKALSSKHLRTGTSRFLTEVLRSLGLYDTLEMDRTTSPDIGALLEKLAGSVLGSLLRQPDSNYVLILDALDENRVYCSIEGIQHLSNQLAEFRCRIILTTRREQLAEQFGNFGVAMTEASAKYGPNRPARLLEFEQWSPDMIENLLEKLLRQADIDEDSKKHLNRFASVLASGEYHDFYGELPKNPLFLSFILEDVVDSGVRTSGRRELIHRWVARKIRRDRASPARLSPDDSLDVSALVDRVLELLRECAGAMIEKKDECILMTETIDEREVLSIASLIFRDQSSSLLALLLNSVMMPIGYRKAGGLKIGFIYQTLQELFLAEYWVRNGFARNGLPSSVQAFCEECGELL